MITKPIRFSILLFLFTGYWLANGQQHQKQESWQEKASSRLSVEAIEQLKGHGMVVVDEGHRQVFSNYVDLPYPPQSSGLSYFVTSDTVLHAFHLLVEATVEKLEVANLVALQAFLDDVMLRFDEGSKIVVESEQVYIPAARKKLNILLGVAAVLLDEDVNNWSDDAEVRAIIKQEVVKVTTASEVSMPKWLGEPRDEFVAIDYQRFKPSGFYQNSVLLSKYFRAVKWLQSVPLWLDQDEDYIGLWALAKGLNPENSEQDNRLEFKGVDSLFGNKSSADINTFSDILDKGSLLEERERVTKSLLSRFPQSTRSHLRGVPAGKTQAVPVTLISNYRLFDSDIFHQTVTNNYNRDFPDGLELAVRAGSEFAKAMLMEKGRSFLEQSALIKLIETEKIYNEGVIYNQWWDTVSLLETGIPEIAPDIFRSQSWQQKSCETMLASWAHMRYAAALHSEPSGDVGGGARTFPGFVEQPSVL